MRKIIYSTIIATMSATIMFGQPVLAAIPEIDLESMTNEELIELRDSINEKIAENGGDNIIGSGVYKVGKDIESGSYKLIRNSNDESSLWAYIFDNETEYNSDKNGEVGMYSCYIQIDSSNDGEREETSMQLSDGQILLIEQGSAIIEKLNASWVPDDTGKETTEESKKDYKQLLQE